MIESLVLGRYRSVVTLIISFACSKAAPMILACPRPAKQYYVCGAQKDDVVIEGLLV